jgi:hypothetical protein
VLGQHLEHRLGDTRCRAVVEGEADGAGGHPVIRVLDEPTRVMGEAILVAVHRAVVVPRPSAEAGALVVGECLLDLGARVHHERPVLGDRLADRAALQDEAFDRRVAGAQFDLDLAVHDGTGRRRDLMAADRHRVALEEVHPADHSFVPRPGHRPRRTGVEPYDQIATSASSRAAHELGGGDAGLVSPIDPATTVTLPPGNSMTGNVARHSIVKYGSTILSAAGG